MENNNDLEREASIEETSIEEQTSTEKTKEPEDENKEEIETEEKKPSSISAQKKHWREKYQSLKKDYEELISKKSEALQKQEDITPDEAERKAQEYIDKRIESLLAKREEKKKIVEKKMMTEFESELDEVLEDNPTLNEKDVLDLCEEAEIKPRQAAKILLRQPAKKDKPKIPSPKGASPEVKIKTEERKPSGDFWQVTDKLLKKLGAE